MIPTDPPLLDIASRFDFAATLARVEATTG